jgi:hypothetical protein
MDTVPKPSNSVIHHRENRFESSSELVLLIVPNDSGQKNEIAKNFSFLALMFGIFRFFPPHFWFFPKI